MRCHIQHPEASTQDPANMTYKRDSRSPMPLNETVSRYMSSNSGKHTQPELTFRKALWHSGNRGYRLHWKQVPGKPDIAFPGRKVAVFVNGCFWHRCPYCAFSIPKHNSDFWQHKFARNVERDQRNCEALVELGWQVLVIWECELKADVENQLQKVTTLLGKAH